MEVPVAMEPRLVRDRIITAVAVCLSFQTLNCSRTAPALRQIEPPASTIHEIVLRCKIDSTWSRSFREFTLDDEITNLYLDPNRSVLGVVSGKPSDKTVRIHTLDFVDGRPGRSYEVPGGTSILELNPKFAVIKEPRRYVNFEKRFEPESILTLTQDSGKVLSNIPSRWLVGDYYVRFLGDTICVVQRSDNVEFWRKHCPRSAPTSSPKWITARGVFWLRDGLWALTPGERNSVWHHSASIADIRLNVLEAAMSLLGSGRFTDGDGYSYNGDSLYGLCSNPMVLDRRVYFASADSLVCLNTESGELIWYRQIPKTTGLSKIDTLDSRTGVVMCYGAAIRNGSLQTLGTPYLAAFDLLTGEERWEFVPQTTAPLRITTVRNGQSCLLTDSTLQVVSSDGKLLARAYIDQFKKPKQVGVVDSIVFLGIEGGVAALGVRPGVGLKTLWNSVIPPENSPLLVEKERSICWLQNRHALVVTNAQTNKVMRSVPVPYYAMTYKTSSNPSFEDILLLNSESSVAILPVNALFEQAGKTESKERWLTPICRPLFQTDWIQQWASQLRIMPDASLPIFPPSFR
jgi:hypothetical protein